MLSIIMYAGGGEYALLLEEQTTYNYVNQQSGEDKSSIVF